MPADHERIGSPGNELSVRRARLARDLAARYSLQLFLLVGVLVLASVKPDFRSVGNLQNILLQASFSGLAACAMTLLITSGMIDLSVAGIVAVSGSVAALLLGQWPISVAVMAALAVGTGLGLINGVIVTRFRFPPFVATFGTLNIYLTLAFVITGDQVVAVQDPTFRELGTGSFLSVPLMFWLLILAAMACHFLLVGTTFGRDLRAVGTNEAAARIAGLRVERTQVVAFALVGLFTAAAAIGLTSLLSSANAIMALGFELNVIAVVVVGGTRLEGGSGSLVGTLTAAILFSALSNGLNLLGVQSYWQYVATGLVLIAALAIVGLHAGAVRADRVADS